MSKLTESPQWQALANHYQETHTQHMRDLFNDDPQRFETFSLRLGDILFDYSKNRITAQTMDLLLALAESTDVKGWTERLFRGEKINFTEDRAVLHVALRHQGDEPIHVDGEDVMPAVRAVLAQMKAFCAKVH